MKNRIVKVARLYAAKTNEWCPFYLYQPRIPDSVRKLKKK